MLVVDGMTEHEEQPKELPLTLLTSAATHKWLLEGLMPAPVELPASSHKSGGHGAWHLPPGGFLLAALSAEVAASPGIARYTYYLSVALSFIHKGEFSLHSVTIQNLVNSLLAHSHQQFAN